LKSTDSRKKLYYSISEVAELTETKAYVLRFWEKEFPTLKPKKNRGGNRIYQEREIQLINRIKTLLYEEGYTIEGARQQLKSHRSLKLVKPAAKATGNSSELRKKIRAVRTEIKDLLKLFS